MSTHNIGFYGEIRKIMSKLSPNTSPTTQLICLSLVREMVYECSNAKLVFSRGFTPSHSTKCQIIPTLLFLFLFSDKYIFQT